MSIKPVEGIYLDFETTGLDPKVHYPTQLAAVSFRLSIDNGKSNLEILEAKHWVIRPPWFHKFKASKYALTLQGRTWKELRRIGISPEQTYREFEDMYLATFGIKYDGSTPIKIDGTRVWAHNSIFDYGFFDKLRVLSKSKRTSISPRNPFSCTKYLFRSLVSLGIIPSKVPDNQDAIVKHYGLEMPDRKNKSIHNPVEDATYGIYILQKMYDDIFNLKR